MGKIANDNFSLWKLNEWFARTIGSLLLSLVQILCYAVFFVEQVFWTLARGIQQPDGSYKTIFDLLVFNNGTLGESLKHNSAITDIVIFMMIVGIFLTILAMVIAIIKYHFSIKDEDQNPRIVIMGVVKAIILIIAFPFIIAVMLKISNALVDSVCTYAGISTGDAKASLANRIFFLFGEHKAEFYDATGQARFSFLMEYNGLKETAEALDGRLLDLPNDNISILKSTGPEGLTQFYVLYEIGFLSSLGMDCYQFVIGIAVILFLLVALFKCLLLLGKRMFDMALLYVVAPLAIASYPADDGKRYNIWKDLMMAKIFSVLGITLGFIIYMVFMREINEVFRDLNPTYYAHLLMAMGDFIKHDSPEALSGVALTVSYIVIAIAGASGLPTAYQMIATLVSETAGHQASADMSNLNADVALMQRGVHFAGGMALAGASGLLKTAGKSIYNPSGAKASLAKGVGGAMGGPAGAVFASGLTRGLSQVAHGGLLSLATNKHKMNKSIKLGDRAEAIRQKALTNWGNRGNEKAIKEYYKRTGVKLGSEERLNFLKQQQDYQRAGINMNDSRSEEFNKRNIKLDKQVHKRAVHDLAKQIHNANKQNKGD